MKEKFESKKRISIIVIIAIIISIFPVFGKDAMAAVKLNATKKTLQVGKTANIKISGAKKAVKWSASNKCIKITKKTSKYAKIKGVKAGSSILKAKVGKKTYKCKVTVKKVFIAPTKSPVPTHKPTVTEKPSKMPEETAFPTTEPTVEPTVEPTIVPTAAPTAEPTISPEPTAKPTENPSDVTKGVKEEYKKYNKGIVGFYTNNNDYDVSISVKMVYYDASGNILDYSTDSNYCLGAGKTTALDFHNPWDKNYDDMEYDSYKANVTVKKSLYVDSSIAISHKENMGDDSLMCSINNIALWKLDFLKLACVFYDENKRIIGYVDHYANCTGPMSSDVISFRYPYDSEYNAIIPASYEIYSKGIY